MTNEFLLQDRIQKIQQIIRKYGEENFYVSYSGGKDSTVLSALIDMALGSQNEIPRVYSNTVIELQLIKDFVSDQQKNDPRIQIIMPKTPIKEMLERDGYIYTVKGRGNFVSPSAQWKEDRLTDGLVRFEELAVELCQLGASADLLHRHIDEALSKERKNKDSGEETI